MNPEELQGRPDDAIQAAADRRHLKPAAMRSVKFRYPLDE
jgi:hypothetical protein